MRNAKQQCDTLSQSIQNMISQQWWCLLLLYDSWFEPNFISSGLLVWSIMIWKTLLAWTIRGWILEQGS
jgi:hypothetical protein